ncbi:helix-turn-helix transcriptional regulator [Bacillus subtilis]|uniref:helix-turn-helix domain-containing protein n=1 Tax=Bacillus subtilis TaxID=1423 RepID=UPI000865C376|nr:helix-turn-helix transcriptional regulator [Bacillus subtilis]AOS69314.1 hypothetical protein A4A60_17420 [Bacillus subtilis]ARW33036.1 hypothetical protein S101441_03516 [Bacillus subtilis subsp. subtilis]MEC0318339.1 helix-turn-helix transcriptional regulator [Bacillus subtilis]MEC0327593.1 helix-turn-helix transcriptional regulator [Bacillus subtilis]MEC0349292.1 helix-turn-helix transcriptional regulator [Bacillus subtilis]
MLYFIYRHICQVVRGCLILCKKTTGEIIKEKRKKAKLTQKKLADMLGVSDSYISKIEKGKSLPSLKFLNNLADKLNVSIKYFF